MSYPSLTTNSTTCKALFEIYRALPEGWVLAGGQAVYLHAIERSAGVLRPAEDADTVLDIRNAPGMLLIPRPSWSIWASSPKAKARPVISTGGRGATP